MSAARRRIDTGEQTGAELETLWAGHVVEGDVACTLVVATAVDRVGVKPSRVGEPLGGTL